MVTLAVEEIPQKSNILKQFNRPLSAIPSLETSDLGIHKWKLVMILTIACRQSFSNQAITMELLLKSETNSGG